IDLLSHLYVMGIIIPRMVIQQNLFGSGLSRLGENKTMEFGFLVDRRRYVGSNFEIAPLDDIQDSIDWLNNEARVSKGWIYPPLIELPLDPSEKKRLPVKDSATWYRFEATHTIRISHDDPDKIRFLILGLGFLFGIYLSPTGYNYIGRVPYKEGKLTGVIPIGDDIVKGTEALSDFYDRHPDERKGMFAAIHWFLLGQTYAHPWDRFDAQYKVLDGLYKISSIPSCSHSRRPVELARYYGVHLPSWAALNNGKSKLSQIRNDLAHEAIYAGEAIGYSNPDEYYDLFFRDFNTKLLAAILNLATIYISSTPEDRQIHAWSFA
ncbi:hypothetical protein SAMN02746065_1508, partial [Desulfocicer vacuolatum DSM 3385]